MDLCIRSDFKDFYDSICSDTGALYKRFLAESMQRGSALRYLRSLGVNTIELDQVSNINRLYTNKVVVYTDTKSHESKGKTLMTLDEAYEMYPAHLASVYYESTNGLTLKYLHVGSKRFRLWFKKESESLEKGQLFNIEKLEDSEARALNVPIYSIDYIFTNRGALATDLNEVQNLEKIGMYNYMSAKEVVTEIMNSVQRGYVK